MKILDRSMVAGLALAQSVACSSAVVTVRAPNADVPPVSSSENSVRYAELLEINHSTKQQLKALGIDANTDCQADSLKESQDMDQNDYFSDAEKGAVRYSPRALSQKSAEDLACVLMERYNECLKSLLQGK